MHEKNIILSSLIEESKEINDDHETKQQSAGNVRSNNLQNKMLSAKEELQKSKEQAINESKMFLSKRLAELERTHNDLDSKNQLLNNKLNLALTEKEQLKQQISTLKNQLKITNEMSGEINLRNHISDKFGLN